MQTTQLSIDGMHCEGCVQIVTHILEQQAGVKGVTVSLESKQARIAHDADQVSVDVLARAVQDAGYMATPTSA